MFAEVDRVVECGHRRDDSCVGVPLYQPSTACHTEPRPGDMYQSEYEKDVFLVPLKCGKLSK